MKNDRSLRNLSRFLEAKSRQSVLESELEARARTKPSITISRQTGAGAVTIAQQLAHAFQREKESLPWAVFDRELVAEVLKSHNLPDRLAEFMTEAKASEIRDVIGQMVGLHPPVWTLVEKTNDTIRRLASAGNAILVGRGAHCVTQRVANVLHVRLVCPLNARIDRVMAYYQVDAAEARRLIEVQDRERRQYVMQYFGRDVEDPLDYHLVINTGMLGDAEVVALIADTVSTHWQK